MNTDSFVRNGKASFFLAMSAILMGGGAIALGGVKAEALDKKTVSDAHLRDTFELITKQLERLEATCTRLETGAAGREGAAPAPNTPDPSEAFHDRIEKLEETVSRLNDEISLLVDPGAADPSEREAQERETIERDAKSLLRYRDQFMNPSLSARVRIETLLVLNLFPASAGAFQEPVLSESFKLAKSVEKARDRAKIYRAMIGRVDATAVPMALAALEGETERTEREELVELLEVGLQDERVIERLKKLAANDPDNKVRRIAKRVLAKIGIEIK